MTPLFPLEKRPLLFGHRGYSALAPENTIPSFDMCIEKHIPGIELDVHLCRTGELVVIHDHQLKRLAGVDGTVEEMSFSELRALDVGSHKGAQFAGERIPLLSEVFERYGTNFYYDIEMKVNGRKNTHLGQKTWEMIKTYHLEQRCMVSSFNPYCIFYFNVASHHAIPTAVIYCEAEDIPRIFWHGWGRYIARATVLKPQAAQVNTAMVARLKRYPIITWTVDDEKQAKDLFEAGVDGIISNNPAPLGRLQKNR